MCGRYVLVTELKAVEKRFGVIAPKPEQYMLSANVSIGEMAPVITNNNPKEISFFQFGLTPHWAKKKMYLINARAEGDHNKENDPNYSGAKGMIKKPAYRHAIRSQRCLVIADAYIEGPEKEKLSKPFLMHMRNHKRPFAFAGVWDYWQDPNSGEATNSFSIITTRPNKLSLAIGHHRMPVILHPQQEKLWLDDELPLSDVTAMLEPYPASEMNGYPISPAIKSSKAKGLELLQPIGERVFKEYDYEVIQKTELQGMGRKKPKSR